MHVHCTSPFSPLIQLVAFDGQAAPASVYSRAPPIPSKCYVTTSRQMTAGVQSSVLKRKWRAQHQRPLHLHYRSHANGLQKASTADWWMLGCVRIVCCLLPAKGTCTHVLLARHHFPDASGQIFHTIQSSERRNCGRAAGQRSHARWALQRSLGFQTYN